MTITNEKKETMFKETLRLETLAGVKTYDGRDYCSMAEGAFMILNLLGLDKEYIKYAEEQTQTAFNGF